MAMVRGSGMLKTEALTILRAALGDSSGEVWDDDELNFVLENSLAQVNQVRPESVVEEISLARNQDQYTFTEPHTVTHIDWIDPAGRLKHDLPRQAWEIWGTNDEEAQTLYVGKLWQKNGYKARTHGWRPWTWDVIVTPTCEGFDETPIEILCKFRWLEEDDLGANMFFMIELMPSSGSKGDASYQHVTVRSEYNSGFTALNRVRTHFKAGAGSYYATGTHESLEWHWLRWQVGPDGYKSKIWKDGETEPTDWQSTAALNGTINPQDYRGIQLYLQSDTDVGYVEVSQLSVVSGFSHGTEEETFTRANESGGWGVSEIFGNTWTPYLTTGTGFSIVDGAGRYTSGGGESAKTIEITVKCD